MPLTEKGKQRTPYLHASNKVEFKVQYNPIIPILKTQFSTRFERLLIENSDPQRHLLILGQPLRKAREGGDLNSGLVP